MLAALLVVPLIAVVIGTILAVLYDNTICNYCNYDGEPCPWCGGRKL